MITFGKNYIYINGKIYREVQPDKSHPTPRWNLVDKKGKRHWITQPQLEKIIKAKGGENSCQK